MDIPFDSGSIMNTEKVEASKAIVKNKADNLSSAELKSAAQGFEAIMVNMLVQAMWKTIPESGLFEKNSASDIYEGITLTALSDEIAKGGGFGIADMLYRQMRKE
ncbi:MAG: rod-binding protein [Candidatus Scalindua sp.]|nr:rod-binding protein [Candidatus Scalindua sp.]